MFDSWIVGSSQNSGRGYVVHTTTPRFIIEIVDLMDGAWKAGALEWLDDPGQKDWARWSQEAAEVYLRSRRTG